MNRIKIKCLWEDRKRWLFFGLPWTFTKYTMTEDKLLIKTGIFTLINEEIRLYRIMDVSLKQTLLQRIFNLGTILVTSNDKSIGDFEIVNIKNPTVVKELLSDKVEEERIKKRVSGREFIVADDGDDDIEDDDGDV